MHHLKYGLNLSVKLNLPFVNLAPTIVFYGETDLKLSVVSQAEQKLLMQICRELPLVYCCCHSDPESLLEVFPAKQTNV